MAERRVDRTGTRDELERVRRKVRRTRLAAILIAAVGLVALSVWGPGGGTPVQGWTGPPVSGGRFRLPSSDPSGALVFRSSFGTRTVISGPGSKVVSGPGSTVVSGPGSTGFPALSELSQDTPQGAAQKFILAWVAWVSSPNPDTWQALGQTVTPDQRGAAEGEWPWGPPALFLGAPPAFAKEGTLLIVTGFSVDSTVWKNEARTEAALQVSFTLLSRPETASPGPGTASTGPTEAGEWLLLLQDDLELSFVEAEGRWAVSSSRLAGGGE